METFAFVVVVFGLLGAVYSGQPEVSCPAPRSPEHGQVYLYQEGSVVKFVCDSGYVLKGSETARCIEGQWEYPIPICEEFGADRTTEQPKTGDEVPVPPSPSRPLFGWGSDDEMDEMDELDEQELDDEMLSDEARIRLLMYPRRRIVTSVHTGKLQSVTELEEEEKKRSQDKSSGSSTTIHMKSPSAVYVRRTIVPGKSETARKALEDIDSLHMTVENGDDVQLITVPRAAVSLDDKTQSDEALRHLYWYSYYNYPRHASLVHQYHNGVPVVMTLSESQLAWINSLHPELRDQYLKDLYVMRADDTVEGERAQALIRRYEDAYAYNYLYHPYLRRPVSLVMEDPISNYDYTCHESGSPFIKAPRLRNMHIARYDRRQNPNNPHNHYLSAVYRCNPGFQVVDTRFTELHCSKKNWIGVRPVCVRRS